MNKMMEKIIEKSGKQLCEVAKISAAISVNSCREKNCKKRSFRVAVEP